MNDKNKLICSDNLAIMANMPGESVDLIYIDPPFFSNRNYEVIWGDDAEIRSFEDCWEGGINVYIDWMKHRVMELHRILKPTGSFYLHCDCHAGHYLKVMCDEIFGYSNFKNDIIWHYRRWTGKAKRFQRLHDNILFYVKSNNYTFNVLYTNYTEGSEERKKQGVLHRFKKGQDPYLVSNCKLNEKGVRENDVWQIPFIAPSSKERREIGYPTQKPITLLEKIIKASSNEGDVVFDAFCGCGTALAVAYELKREWIGIDISPSAIALVKNRLNKVGVREDDYIVIGMPKTIEDLKNFTHYDFQFWAINELHGMPSPRKSGDMGIDGFTYMKHYPIQVRQSESVGRNVIDNFETAIRRYNENQEFKATKGLVIAFSFGRGAKEEVARAKKEGFNIKLVTIQDMLDKKFTADNTLVF